jgi:hypothetical protein
MFNGNGELNKAESVVHKLGLRQNVHITILTTKAKGAPPRLWLGVATQNIQTRTNPGKRTKDPIINYDLENKKQVES